MRTRCSVATIAVLWIAACGSPSPTTPVDGGDDGPDARGPEDPPILCTDQCVYVRDGGTGTGADWGDALDDLPAALERGKVYFVAAGAYAARDFETPPSGEERIVIKRAVASNHGTDAGWQPSYGEGQATWTGTLSFKTAYWTFDGSTRDEGDWFDGDAYGFRIDHGGTDQQIVISNYGVDTSYVTIRLVYVDAIVGNLPSETIRRYAIDTDGFDGGTTARGLVFTRMFVRGSNNVWFLRTTDGALLEYSASELADSNDGNHGEVVNLYYSGENATIRYNRWRDSFIGTIGTAMVAITAADGLSFYGNEVVRFATGDGAIGFDGQASSGNRIFNNTFVDGTGFNSGVVFGAGTDNQIYNNLFIDCATVRIEGDHDFNAFSDDNDRGEANAQVNVPRSILTDPGADDVRLSSATAPGQAMGPPYDHDLDGDVRGADGVVDRGADELP